LKSQILITTSEGTFVELKYTKNIPEADLIDLYSSVQWSSYTGSPSLLKQAIQNSAHVVSLWDEEKLVALARCISDDATIMYLQDVLVRPEYQRRGYASKLVNDCLSRYGHVRQTVLLTDDSNSQQAFYKSLGLQNTKDYEDGMLNNFIRFK
jgi:ribosomal protein S18 acetylase RimI-like enzyme